MSKISLLKKINRAISSDKVDFSAVDSEIIALKKKLEETVNIQTVDDVSRKLKQFQNKIDFEPIIREINKISEVFTNKVKTIQSQIDTKTKELESFDKTISENSASGMKRTHTLKMEIASLSDDLARFIVVHEADINALKKNFENIDLIGKNTTETIQILSSNIDTRTTKKETKKYIEELQDTIDKFRIETLNRISSVGGGSMNRKITVGGVDYLTRYTDLNLIAGTNMTLTVANDDANKRVNITFDAAGGSLNFETPTGAVDDSNTSFTVANEPKLLNINGAVYTEGVGIYTSYVAGTITLSSPVGTGGFIISIY